MENKNSNLADNVEETTLSSSLASISITPPFNIINQ